MPRKDLKLGQAKLLFNAPASPEHGFYIRAHPGSGGRADRSASPTRQRSSRGRSKSPEPHGRRELQHGSTEPDTRRAERPVRQEPVPPADVGTSVTTTAPTASSPTAGSMTDDALRQQWQAPLAGYKRERALQAQRMRNLGAMERALQRRASSSALAQHFVRGVMSSAHMHLQLLVHHAELPAQGADRPQGLEAAGAPDAGASSRGTPETERLIDAVIVEALVEDAAVAGVVGMNSLQGWVPAGQYTDEGDLQPPDEALAPEDEAIRDDTDDAIDGLLQDLLEGV